jgi:2-keto-4-pentenoate hydratase/2-oxohepta-3-ene-1,7-dioic acid hydratase in catechol pathway
MQLGRILRASTEGGVPRLVAAQPAEGRVIDLLTAEYDRLLRNGATAEAARRVANALFPPSMAEALGAGPLFLEAAQRSVTSLQDERALLSMKDVTWLAPIDPPVMRDCLVFETHLRNSFTRLLGKVPEQYYEMPLYYKGNPLTLIGHEQEVPWPDYTQRLDYELELGFVVGRAGRDLAPEQARAHLFGVTIFDDFSARDIQLSEMQGMLGPAKGKDFATALGPWITTVDELDVHDLSMLARVNGEEWSRGSSASMMWKIEEIIAYISKCEGIQAGELIGSGTVGFGCGLELGRLLQAGDVVELEVEGIGVLRNRVGSPAPGAWVPQKRTPEA